MARVAALPEVEFLELGLEGAPIGARPGPHPPGARLSVVGLDVAYGGHRVVTDVHLQVHPGEVVALVGHNGSGKSSTLRAVFGLVPRGRGEVALDGVPVAPGRANPAMLGFVPDRRPVFEDLSVAENLRLGGGDGEAEAVAERAGRVLALFPELGRRLRVPAGRLSGGEQRMVGLGIALMRSPRALLLDEPTKALSPAVAARVLAALRSLAVRNATAVLLAEVNLAAALGVADRVYVMRSGRVESEHVASDLVAAGPLSWWRLM